MHADSVIVVLIRGVVCNGIIVRIIQVDSAVIIQVRSIICDDIVV